MKRYDAAFSLNAIFKLCSLCVSVAPEYVNSVIRFCIAQSVANSDACLENFADYL